MSKKYNVYGIGNAIVDIVTEVNYDFFDNNKIEKGVMTLVDEQRQLELMNVIDMKKSKVTGGGSVGNTIAAISQFGGSTFYSCMVAQDDLGKFFIDDLKKNNVDTNLKHDTCPAGHTGRCLVMTSPDALRTMNTFLGINSVFAPAHLDEEAIKNSAYVYLEGYLVTSPNGLAAMKETKRLAEKHKVNVALTFSDPSMVKYFGAQMEEIVGASVDLLFCNDEEAMIFTRTSSIEEAKHALKKVAKRFAITLGANGALVFDGDTFIEIAPYKVQAVDTNGAGDMFAGAFLYAINNGHSYAEAGKLASLASSKVVTQWGPRLEAGQAKKVLAELVP
jgi:sugar/nucleoside kinase (ribokinase family)